MRVCMSATVSFALAGKSAVLVLVVAMILSFNWVMVVVGLMVLAATRTGFFAGALRTAIFLAAGLATAFLAATFLTALVGAAFLAAGFASEAATGLGASTAFAAGAAAT